MKDKKERQDDWINSLVPFAFTEAEMQEHFSIVAGDYHGFALVKDMKEAIAYLCLEEFGDTVTAHIWIPVEKRSKDNILWIRDKALEDIKIWVSMAGKKSIVTNCAYDDEKTKGLLDTLGFSVAPIWFGIINVQED